MAGCSRCFEERELLKKKREWGGGGKILQPDSQAVLSSRCCARRLFGASDTSASEKPSAFSTGVAKSCGADANESHTTVKLNNITAKRVSTAAHAGNLSSQLLYGSLDCAERDVGGEWGLAELFIFKNP